MNKLLYLLLGALSSLILLALVLAFMSVVDEVESRPISYFEIDGMPCVETERGISCDWLKWEGK